MRKICLKIKEWIFFKQREKNVKAALNEDANCCIFEHIDFFIHSVSSVIDENLIIYEINEML